MDLTQAMAKVAALRRPHASQASLLEAAVPDVFISYAMPDDEKLASDLELRLEGGRYRTWRATRIRGGEVLNVAIRRALIAARAVVVLWTPCSVDRQWVYSEALMARDHGKLVPLRAGAVARASIPPPFNALSTLDIDDAAGLAAALLRLGVRPSAAS